MTLFDPLAPELQATATVPPHPYISGSADSTESCEIFSGVVQLAPDHVV
jgi:hypothetical protein